MKSFVLASNSPRRKELLLQAGFQFSICAASIAEEINPKIPIANAIEEIALKKAKAVQSQYSDEIIIGADTAVVLDKEVFGKPKDKQEARMMLERLSGKTHQVITGVAIVCKQKVEVFHVVSDVTFYDLDDMMLDTYLQNDEYMDKAGAYGIQGKACIFVKTIAGDYYNIVGLPIAKLYQTLRGYNIK